MKIIAALALALGLGAAQPVMAATTTSTQCAQAQASVDKLNALAASSSGATRQAYLNMAKGAQTAMAYYCH